MNKTAIIDGIEYELVPKAPEVNQPVNPSAKEWLMDYLSKGFDKVDLSVKDHLTYYRNGQWIFDLDMKRNVLWCNFYEVWEVFYKEYDMDYNQTQQLMRDTVLEPLNCKGFTPIMIAAYNLRDADVFQAVGESIENFPLRDKRTYFLYKFGIDIDKM